MSNTTSCIKIWSLAWIASTDMVHGSADGNLYPTHHAVDHYVIHCCQRLIFHLSREQPWKRTFPGWCWFLEIYQTRPILTAVLIGTATMRLQHWGNVIQHSFLRSRERKLRKMTLLPLTLFALVLVSMAHSHSDDHSHDEEPWDEIYLCKKCKQPLAHQKKVIGWHFTC